MVTETLENGILIQIDTSQESDFNADFKYISFIKFNQVKPIKSYAPEKIWLIFKKGRNTP
jgi:hypothetical protein